MEKQSNKYLYVHSARKIINLIISLNLLNIFSEKMNHINYTKYGKWKHFNNLEMMEL
jgi:hypothetical protein